MPVVRFVRSSPRPDGSVGAASGRFRFRPTRARVIVGDPDVTVTAQLFDVVLIGGAADVTLTPTSAGWAWQVFESVDGVKDLTYYVAVPDVPGPLDDADLPRMDPSTLSPRAVPEAAWWPVANSTITNAVVDGDDLVLTRHDGTQVVAGRVTPTPDQLTAEVSVQVDATLGPAVAAAVPSAVNAAINTALPPAVTAAVTPAVNTAVTAAVGPAATAAVQAATRPSNMALDVDGVPFISPGANTVFVYADTDGRPYFVS